MAEEVSGEILLAENLLGKYFEEGSEKRWSTSAILGLSGNRPINMAGQKAGILRFDGNSAASFVGESQSKPPANAGISSQPINSGTEVIQNRVTRQFLKWDETAQTNLMDKLLVSQIARLNAGIDILTLHGTNPSTGLPAGNEEGNNIKTYLTENITNEVVEGDSAAAIDQALLRAINSLVDFGEDVGIIMDKQTHFKLAAWETESGLQRLPGMNVSQRELSTYRGFPVRISNTIANTADKGARLAPEGTETGVKAIIGDFSKIRIGVEFDQPEFIWDANPDGLGDLRNKNEFLIRNEVHITYFVEYPEAFVALSTAEEV